MSGSHYGQVLAHLHYYQRRGWWSPGTVKQHRGGRHLQLVQRGIQTIVPLWRQFQADADADSISSTVMSPPYMYIENERIIYSSQMWHEMQSKQHFITNLIVGLQIWVHRPFWPDPTRPAHPSKFSDPTGPMGRVKDRATLRLQTLGSLLSWRFQHRR